MNVFIINSPLQLLSAIEAKLQFNTENNILVIMYCSDPRTEKQIDTLISMHSWSTIIPLKRQSKTLRIPKLINAIKKCSNHIDTLFSSSIDNINCQAILSNFSIQKLYYIDDGMSLINFNNKYLSHHNFKIPQPNLFLRLTLLAQGVKLRTHDDFVHKLSVFTMLPIKHCSRPIIINPLTWLKSNITIIKEKVIGFIGQAEIVGNKKNELPFEQHIHLLTKIHQENGAKIIYFPHRRENIEQLKHIAELPFLRMHNPTLPLELELAIANIGLSKLIGYTSTALYSMDHLYKNIEVSFIKPSQYINQPTENLLEIERYIEETLMINKWDSDPI